MLLEVEALEAAYGRIRALKGVSLAVGQGEIVALVGGNGAGKTTLLRCLSGVQPAAAGVIRFDGADITRRSPHARVAAGIAQSPEGRQVFAPLSVEDNLRLGAWRRGRDGAAREMDAVFTMFPILAEKRALPAGGLSGGQQQMLAIGRALMSRPRLLLLDEPSMGLAPLLVEQIMRTVVRLRQERGVAVLLVEQNAVAALSIADRGHVIETGRIGATGTGQALLQDPAVRAAYLGL